MYLAGKTVEHYHCESPSFRRLRLRDMGEKVLGKVIEIRRPIEFSVDCLRSVDHNVLYEVFIIVQKLSNTNLWDWK